VKQLPWLNIGMKKLFETLSILNNMLNKIVHRYLHRYIELHISFQIHLNLRDD
jgi:hypothetical protein